MMENNESIDDEGNSEVSSLESVADSDEPMSSEEKRYACIFEGCNKSFGRPWRLLIHKRVHEGDRPFICSYEGCNKSYTRQYHLTRHEKNSHLETSSVSEMLTCENCNRNYSNKYSLQKHVKSCLKGYKCTECKCGFKKHSQLTAHILITHKGLNPYKCDYPGCDKNFTFPNKLKDHKKIHEPDRYKCNKCSATFDKHNLYRNHMKTHSEIKKCCHCSKKFSSINKLLYHIETKHEEPKNCPYCEKKFSTNGNLAIHIKHIHDPSKPSYKCYACDKTICTANKLKYHIVAMHGKRKQTKSSKKPRKPRKDKGIKKGRNISIHSILSNYNPNTDVLNDSFLSTCSIHEDLTMEDSD